MEQISQSGFDAAPAWVVSFADLILQLNFFILLPIFVAVGTLLVSYFKNYQRPAESVRDSLVRLVEAVRSVRRRRGGDHAAMGQELDGIFAIEPFKSLWMEYCGSLHAVRAKDGDGGSTALLATVPAEMVFSKESIVDLYINADFYRHLPGILTGIGIIGTFSGLVWGLHEFKADPTEALASLPLLLQEVTSAFIGSGFAILAAIFVTYKEKSVLNQCYRAVDELNREIDALYAKGVGEEYLSRLVKATESGSDSFARMIEKQNEILSVQVAAAIRDALAEPMAQLSGAVQRVTRDQEEAVGMLLDSTLRSFAVRLEDLFGRQMTDLSQSFQKSTEAINQVQAVMVQLVSDMSEAGTSAVGQMSGTLSEAMVMAAQSQEQTSEKLRQFMDELRELLMKQQNQSSEIMDVTMRAVLSKLQAALNHLAVERGQQIEQDQRRHEELAAAVAKLVERLDTAAAQTAENLGVIQSTTTGAISGMNNGAVIMRMAADRFTLAGNTLAGALERSKELADSLAHLQGVIESVSQFRRTGT